MQTNQPATSLLYDLPSIVDRISLQALFARPQPIEVELGCGDASFLVEHASRNQDRNFIGVERLLGRLGKLDRKGRRAALTNLCGIRIESAYFLKYLLPARSAAALHVYFPDPWPKKKHHKNRLINEKFPELAGQALLPGGSIFLRTDDRAYFAQMVEVFQSCREFEPAETPAHLAAVVTDFEAEFNSKGIPTLYAAYRLRSP